MISAKDLQRRHLSMNHLVIGNSILYLLADDENAIKFINMCIDSQELGMKSDIIKD